MIWLGFAKKIVDRRLILCSALFQYDYLGVKTVIDIELVDIAKYSFEVSELLIQFI